MITNFKSPEVTANISAQELFTRFSNLNNLKDFVPEDIEEFQSTEDSCSFKVSKLPKISLQMIEKVRFNLIKLQSKDNQISFDLNCKINENPGQKKCQVTLEIDIELNFMMKMMVEKPLNQFLEKLSAQIKKI